jgi:hypothetical protein
VISSCGLAPKRKSIQSNEESLMNMKKKVRDILPFFPREGFEFFVQIAEIYVKFW